MVQYGLDESIIYLALHKNTQDDHSSVLSQVGHIVVEASKLGVPLL